MGYIQSASIDSGSVSTANLSFPANVTAGSTIIVGVRYSNNGSVLTVTDSLGNPYTILANLNDGDGQDLICAYSQNVIGGACQVTISLTLGPAAARWCIGEYGGVTTASVDKTSGAVGLSTTPNSGNTATTSQANEILVGIIDGASNQTSFSAGSGYTTREQLIVAGPLFKIALEDQTVSATGAYAADGTVAGPTGNWAARIITLKIASSAPPFIGASVNQMNKSLVMGGRR